MRGIEPLTPEIIYVNLQIIATSHGNTGSMFVT